MVGRGEGHIKRSVSTLFSLGTSKRMLMNGIRYMDWYGFRTWGHRAVRPIEGYLEMHTIPLV